MTAVAGLVERPAGQPRSVAAPPPQPAALFERHGVSPGFDQPPYLCNIERLLSELSRQRPASLIDLPLVVDLPLTEVSGSRQCLSSHAGGRAKVFSRILIAVTAAAIVATAAMTAALFIYGSRLGWVSLAALLLSGAYYFFKCHQPDDLLASSRLEPPIPEQVDRADLVWAESYIERAYSAPALYGFLRGLVFAQAHLSRVNERMDLSDQEGTVSVTITFRRTGALTHLSGRAGIISDQSSSAAPATDDSPVFLCPLVSVRKGLLFDGFEALDQSGKTLPTLPQWEVRGLLVTALSTIFRRADDLTTEANPTEPRRAEAGPQTWRKQLRFAMLEVAVNTICATLPPNPDARRARQKATQDAIDKCQFSDQAKELIEDFVKSLDRDYLIVVEVPRADSNNIAVSYSHRVTPAVVSLTAEQRLRAKHGLSPQVVDAPMTWAFRPDSYHFELLAPAGQFIFDHRLELLETREILKQERFSVAGVQQYVRLHQERGHQRAHLYIRRVRYNSDQAEGTPDFKSVIRFREVPPGVMGGAATLAFFTAAVIAFNAFVLGVPLPGAPPSQGILGLILALPAFIAAALGRGLSSDTVSRTSITTFYGLWAIVFSSVVAVGLLTADINKVESLRFTLRVLGEDKNFNLAWTGLAAATIVLYLFLRKEKADHRRYYLRLLRNTARSGR